MRHGLEPNTSKVATRTHRPAGWRGGVAPLVPGQEGARGGGRPATPKASSSVGERMDDELQETVPADRVPARFLNPSGAPLVIDTAWTPRQLPAPNTNEAERA